MEAFAEFSASEACSLRFQEEEEEFDLTECVIHQAGHAHT